MRDVGRRVQHPRPADAPGYSQFFDQNQNWLAALLEAGREAGTLGFAGPVERAAQTIVAALEGAMLVARPYDNAAVLDAVIDRLSPILYQQYH